MRERVRQLGGQLNVSSNGNGTVVTASLPLQNAMAQPAAGLDASS